MGDFLKKLTSHDSPDAKGLTLQRLEWLDYAKAIGITLVVLGHVIRGLKTDIVGSRLDSYLALDFLIYTFHMPLFFFASGAVFSLRLSYAPCRFVGRMGIGLIAPYAIWSAAFVLAQQPIGSHVNHLYNINQLGHIWQHPIAHMWFLFALIFIQAGFYVGYRVGGFSGMALVGGLCLLCYLYPESALSVDRLAPGAASGGTFFGIGFAATVCARFHKWNISPALILILCFISWASLAVTMLEMPKYEVMAPAAAAAGVLMTVAACVMLPQARGVLAIAALIGQSSIAIYVLHVFFGASIRMFLYRLNVTNCDLHVISETVAGIVFPTVIFVLANRFALSPYFGFGPTRKLRYLALARL